MARFKHFALIVAVKLVSLIRLTYHGLGRLLAPAAGGSVRGGGKLLRTAVLPVYSLSQRARRWITNADAASVTSPTVTLNAAVFLAVIVATGAAFAASAADGAAREDLGRGAYIGILLQSTDEFYDDELLEEEGPATAAVTPITDYLDAEALQSELQPIRATSTLVYSGNEDTLLPFETGPSGIRTRNNVETYAVQSGDTIGSIARQFGLRVTTLLWANNLTERSLIRINQQLTIPPVNGVIHIVKKGDTLASIAKRYSASADEIANFNRLGSAALQPGTTVVVPGGTPPAVPRVATPSAQPGQTRVGAVPPAAAPNSATRLLWPTSGRRITQYFTYRHSGLDVGNKKGQPIYAAEDGVVVRSQWNTGYGYNVVIDHGGGMRTLYGHSSQLLVRTGDKVTRGQVIALIGSTGRSTGPHLHFEVVVGGVRRNPLSYTR